MVVSALALIGVFVALYLTLYKIGAIGALACNIGHCETVNTSRWSRLAGFPVAMWGLAFYVVLFVVATLGVLPRLAGARWVSNALVLLSGWGVLFSGWLTYLELFVIHAICIWCVTSAVLVTLAFIASLLDRRGIVAEPGTA
jgi:uncharacterized membrane protein